MRKAEEISVSPVVAKKLSCAVRIRHQIDEMDIVEYEFPEPLTREEAVALEHRAWVRDRWITERAWFKIFESDLLVVKLRLLRPSRKFRGVWGVPDLGLAQHNEKGAVEKPSADVKPTSSDVSTSASDVSTRVTSQNTRLTGTPLPPKPKIAALAQRAGDARLLPLIERYVELAQRLPDIRALTRLAGWPEYSAEDFVTALELVCARLTNERIPPLGVLLPSEHKLRQLLGLKNDERRTWLTAYAEAFTTAYPEATFLFGPWAKTLKRLEDTHGRERALANWIRYVNSTPSSFFSMLSFESKWAARTLEPNYLPEP